MRKFACLMGLLLLAGLSARAQDNSKVQIFGGYSYVRFLPNAGSDAPSSVNFNGGVGSISYTPIKWVGIVAEGGYYKSGALSVNGTVIPGASVSAATYLFGPKLVIPMKRISPFVQILFGGVHGTPSGFGAGETSQTARATALGGGVDWYVTSHIGLRLAQFEYFRTQFSDQAANSIGTGGTGTQNNLRYSAGVVLRF